MLARIGSKASHIRPTHDGSYEWLLIVDGNISHSNDGFGSIDAALIKGMKVFLSHMEGDER